MSASNSIGTYDSLFDDDEGTLGGICFDLDVRKEAPGERWSNAISWCKSSASSSSCCSLCRPPTVSEAEDESGTFGLALGAGNNTPCLAPRHCQGQEASFSRFDLGRSPFQAPLKCITIPRNCLRPGVTEPFPPPLAPPDSNGAHDRPLGLGNFLPDDALCHAIKFLDVPSLLRLRECSWRLREVSSGDGAGWRDRCASLWSTKAGVCRAARALLAESSAGGGAPDPTRCSAMEAYRVSVADAATRREITAEELCYDGDPGRPGVVWSFRFKESAGRDWTSWDPWWAGRGARRLVFLRDGTILQTYPPGPEGSLAPLSSAGDGNGLRLYSVFSERTVRHEDGTVVPAPRIEMRWRFVSRPLDLPTRPGGAYIRIAVGGRDVPTYVARRSPNGNWGFVLESCWGVYASFDMASCASSLPLSAARAGFVSRPTRRRLRRTRTDGSRWVDIEDSDAEDDDEREENAEESGRERMRNVRRRIELFVEESAITQDRYSQWREALLYNIGAVTLPEGNGDATQEFDNAWQRAMMIR